MRADCGRSVINGQLCEARREGGSLHYQGGNPPGWGGRLNHKVEARHFEGGNPSLAISGVGGGCLATPFYHPGVIAPIFPRGVAPPLYIGESLVPRLRRGSRLASSGLVDGGPWTRSCTTATAHTDLQSVALGGLIL